MRRKRKSSQSQPGAGGVSGEAGYFFIMGVGNCALCVCPGRTGFLLYTVFENVYNICCVSSKRVYLIRINLYMPETGMSEDVLK